MKTSILYHHAMSSPSRKVRIFINERNIRNIELRSLDIVNGEQFQDWFLDLNPKGEVPLLVHFDEEENRTIVTESTEIMKFLDKRSGEHFLFDENKQEEEDLQETLDTLGTYVLTWGTICHIKSLSEYTSVIRYPHCKFLSYPSFLVRRRMFDEKPGNLQQIADKKGPGHPSHEALRKKADFILSLQSIANDPQEFEARILSQVEELMGRVEDILSSEDRVGSFLFGSVYSGVDISLSALMYRLYQLGMDEYFWGNGTRPHLSVYYKLIMERASVVNDMEEERLHSHEMYKVGSTSEAEWAGYTGLLGVLCLAGFYLFKKLK